MIDRGSVSVRLPGERITRHGRRNSKTVADARLDFGSFLIVIPCHQLQIGKLVPGIVKAVDLRECVQPGLPALLAHDPSRSPGRQRVVESFVRRADRLFVRECHPRVVETREVTAAVVGGHWHYPGITASAQCMGESIVVLKKKMRLRGQRRVHCVPVDRIGKINVEVRNHRTSLHGHVCGRGEISLLDILQLADQRLLR